MGFASPFGRLIPSARCSHCTTFVSADSLTVARCSMTVLALPPVTAGVLPVQVGDSVRAAFASATSALVAAGCVVSTTARPALDARSSHTTYLRLLAAATAPRMPPADYEALCVSATALEPVDRSERAEEARWITARHTDWLQAAADRQALRAAWHTFFEDWDVLLMPVAPAPALLHDHSDSEAQAPYWRCSSRVVPLDIPAEGRASWAER